MDEFWSETPMNELPWVSRTKAALTRVQTKVVEVGEVLSCVLTWVVEVVWFPSWKIVVVAEAVMISYLALDKKIMRQSKGVKQINFWNHNSFEHLLPPYDKSLENPLIVK